MLHPNDSPYLSTSSYKNQTRREAISVIDQSILSAYEEALRVTEKQQADVSSQAPKRQEIRYHRQLVSVSHRRVILYRYPSSWLSIIFISIHSSSSGDGTNEGQ